MNPPVGPDTLAGVERAVAKKLSRKRQARLWFVGVAMIALPGFGFVLHALRGQPWTTGDLIAHGIWLVAGLCVFDYEGAGLLLGNAVKGIGAWRK